LNQTSAVTCGNLFTVAQTKVLRVVGSLSPAMMARIQVCLKVALELPFIRERVAQPGLRQGVETMRFRNRRALSFDDSVDRPPFMGTNTL
jgi:hypothetical protein